MRFAKRITYHQLFFWCHSTRAAISILKREREWEEERKNAVFGRSIPFFSIFFLQFKAFLRNLQLLLFPLFFFLTAKIRWDHIALTTAHSFQSVFGSACFFARIFMSSCATPAKFCLFLIFSSLSYAVYWPLFIKFSLTVNWTIRRMVRGAPVIRGGERSTSCGDWMVKGMGEVVHIRELLHVTTCAVGNSRTWESFFCNASTSIIMDYWIRNVIWF